MLKCPHGAHVTGAVHASCLSLPMEKEVLRGIYNVELHRGSLQSSPCITTCQGTPQQGWQRPATAQQRLPARIQPVLPALRLDRVEL